MQPSFLYPSLTSPFFWSPSSWHLLLMPVDSTLDTHTRSQLLPVPGLDLPLLVPGPIGTFTSLCMGMWQLWNLQQTPHPHGVLGPGLRPSLSLKSHNFCYIALVQGTLEAVLSQSRKDNVTQTTLLWIASSAVFWRSRYWDLVFCLFVSPPALPFSPIAPFSIISYSKCQNFPFWET